MTYELLTDRQAMEHLRWHFREDNGGLVGFCCGRQVISRMPNKPRLENPIELYCNQCGARMVSIWMLPLPPEEKRKARETKRFWVAEIGSQEKAVQLGNHTYRMLAQREHTDGQWHGTVWKDGVRIWDYADEIRLGAREANHLEQVKQMLCYFAHSDSGDAHHECDWTCSRDWRSGFS